MKKKTLDKNRFVESEKLTDHTSENPNPELAMNMLDSGQLMKNFFFISLVIMLLITWVSGFNVGFNPDEMDMNSYGKANYSYYFSGGKDTSCLGYYKKDGTVDSYIRYYGSSFDYIAIAVNKITGIGEGVNEFNSRHIIAQFFGILTILFAGLIARKLVGWRTAFFTAWLIFLSPSFAGHFYFNTKDIPFCTGYLATLYFIIEFLSELPNPTWRTSFFLMLALYFTIDLRIGGILLIFYFLLFTLVYLQLNKELLKLSLKNVKNIILKYLVIIVGSNILLIVSWPWVLHNPASNLWTAITIIKKFPIKNNVTFEGTVINSLELPAHYLPKMILVTAPLLVIILVVTGLLFLFLRMRKFDMKMMLLVLFSVFFPPIYAIINHVAIYGGWRHFLFIYPGLCVIAAIGLNELLDSMAKQMVKAVVMLLCLLALFRPVAWTVKNSPYQYCYFNEIAGGFKTAYYNYDTDYWSISVKKSVDWLMEHEPVTKSIDTVTIATNMVTFLKYYVPKHYPGSKVKIVSSGVTGRNALYWQYAVYNTLFLKPDYLENFFPPPQSVYSESIDGLPVTVVVKDTARLDFKALDALKLGNHKLSDSLYTAHIAITKDENPAVDAYISVAKASTNQNDAAIAAANRALQYHLSNVLDYNAQCGLGIAYANKGQFELSIAALNLAGKLMPNEHYSSDILQQVYKVRRAEKSQKK